MAVLTGNVLAGIRYKSDGDQTVEIEIVVDHKTRNGGAFCDALRESSKVIILQGKDRLEYLEWVAKAEDSKSMPSLP